MKRLENPKHAISKHFMEMELIGIKQVFGIGKRGWVDVDIKFGYRSNANEELKRLAAMGYQKVNLICRDNRNYFPTYQDFYPDYAISELVKIN